MDKFIIIFVMMFLFNKETHAILSCSKSGTDIIYINGIMVPSYTDAFKTSENIGKIIGANRSVLDESSSLNYRTVHNFSRGLNNDLEELKTGAAINYLGKTRQEYWRDRAKKKALGINVEGQLEETSNQELKKFNDSLEQILQKKKVKYNVTWTDKQNYKFSVGTEQNTYTEEMSYKDTMKYNSSLAELLANANSELSVVEDLKFKILESYNKGDKKVIVVSHSQGNEVLYSAIKELRNDSNLFPTANALRRFDSLIGYVQVAPPSKELVTASLPANYYDNHAQYIRSANDLVIGYSDLITGVIPVASNYTPPSFLSKTERSFYLYGTDQNANTGLFSFYSRIFASNANVVSTYGFHGMDDYYLSSNYSAARNSTGQSKSFREHFKDNLIEVASKLADNCDPVSNFTVSSVYLLARAAIDNNTQNFFRLGQDAFQLEWDFGDGSPKQITSGLVSGLVAEHLYGREGSYKITLRLLRPSGELVSESFQNINIEDQKWAVVGAGVDGSNASWGPINDACSNLIKNGVGGWHLASQEELLALENHPSYTGFWTSTEGSYSGSHIALYSGGWIKEVLLEYPDDRNFFGICVRP